MIDPHLFLALWVTSGIAGVIILVWDCRPDTVAGFLRALPVTLLVIIPIGALTGPVGFLVGTIGAYVEAKWRIKMAAEYARQEAARETAQVDLWRASYGTHGRLS